VDVAAYANWAGAYTTLDPLRVTISSLDSRNQGSEALEVLFHEASHGIAEPVQDAIIRECRQRDKAIPRDLWHALIFYTTGEVIRPVLASSDATPRGELDLRSPTSTSGSSPTSARENSRSTSAAGYTPYALREGLYERGWKSYLDVLQRFWQPYIDGRATFSDAIAPHGLLPLSVAELRILALGRARNLSPGRRYARLCVEKIARPSAAQVPAMRTSFPVCLPAAPPWS